MTSTPKVDKNGQEAETTGAEHTSGHRGSLRGANKLARRARSFKDDLIERISAMRSPAQNHHGHHQPHLSNVFRSHPISPKMRTPTGKQPENHEVSPVKELEQLVKEVQFELKHFCDVIKKDKLEMLPGNGTIVFDTVSNIYSAIKPYATRTGVAAALSETCAALGAVLRLCDEAVRPTDPNVLTPESAHQRVQRLLKAVGDAFSLASVHMNSRPALAPRPPLVTHRTHRNSLPDIPLTERERAELCGGGAGNGGRGDVRAAHSTESVLEAPPPPPKPPLPHGKLELAPPLPPKRKQNNHHDSTLLNSSGVDSRLSLQSHSSGSMDSLLNASHDDEVTAIMDADASHNSNVLCSCTSDESLAAHDAIVTVSAHNKRFSAESGFSSMHAPIGGATLSALHQTTSVHASSFLDTSDGIYTESKTVTLRHESVSTTSTTSSLFSGEFSDEKPALPTKTRRPLIDPNAYPGVEIRSNSNCALHGSRHTLAAQRPPPLPLKKKHIMAYMEMFGNCSHPGAMVGEHEANMFRHSIHVSNMTAGDACHGGIAQSMTLHHFSSHGTELSTSTSTIPSREESPEPPALPPKKNKSKQPHCRIEEIEPLPSLPEVRSQSCNSDNSLHVSALNNVPRDDEVFRWSSPGPGKFPLEEEIQRISAATPSPVPPERRSATPHQQQNGNSDPNASIEIMLENDVTKWLLFEEGGAVRGGHPHALVVLATKPAREFAYQEAFLTTYRTWIDAETLVRDLCRRAKHLSERGPGLFRPTLSLLTRVTADLTPMELDEELLKMIIDFVYWVIESGELSIGKAMRLILLEKYKEMQGTSEIDSSSAAVLAPVRLRRETLLDFKADELAAQMTLLDAELFGAIAPSEVLTFIRHQSEERSPNLTRFTEHFNKVSFWARSRILEQDEQRDRDRIATQLLKVMKGLRKLRNFNSYLALVSALDSAPVRRLPWRDRVLAAVAEHARLIDSSGSFRAYRNALRNTQPPAIPYIGIILQDLTFVHDGNPDYLPEGGVNFSKRLLQYHIMEDMKRFHKGQYSYRKNERILAMFNDFDDVLSEETLWQISEAIKPRRPGPLVEAAA